MSEVDDVGYDEDFEEEMLDEDPEFPVKKEDTKPPAPPTNSAPAWLVAEDVSEATTTSDVPNPTNTVTSPGGNNSDLELPISSPEASPSPPRRRGTPPEETHVERKETDSSKPAWLNSNDAEAADEEKGNSQSESVVETTKRAHSSALTPETAGSVHESVNSFAATVTPVESRRSSINLIKPESQGSTGSRGSMRSDNCSSRHSTPKVEGVDRFAAVSSPPRRLPPLPNRLDEEKVQQEQSVHESDADTGTTFGLTAVNSPDAHVEDAKEEQQLSRRSSRRLSIQALDAVKSDPKKPEEGSVAVLSLQPKKPQQKTKAELLREAQQRIEAEAEKDAKKQEIRKQRAKKELQLQKKEFQNHLQEAKDRMLERLKRFEESTEERQSQLKPKEGDGKRTTVPPLAIKHGRRKDESGSNSSELGRSPIHGAGPKPKVRRAIPAPMFFDEVDVLVSFSPPRHKTPGLDSKLAKSDPGVHASTPEPRSHNLKVQAAQYKAKAKSSGYGAMQYVEPALADILSETGEIRRCKVPEHFKRQMVESGYQLAPKKAFH